MKDENKKPSTSTSVKESEGGVLAETPSGSQASICPPELNDQSPKGGQITISPPTNVTFDTSAKLLANNYDYLQLALYVKWKDTKFIDHLKERKELAIENNREMPATFINPDASESYQFSVKTHGTKGHEWLLSDKEYTLTVGNWFEPIQRPSINLKINSETLWRKGLSSAVNDILGFLKTEGATITDVLVSRVDMCCDILVDESFWSDAIANYRVTRAKKLRRDDDNNNFTGMTIGRGNLLARIYDKAYEISSRSGKVWMFDRWGIDEVPPGSKVLRVEFQIRRTALKELGVSTYQDLKKLNTNLWAYFTQSWLKFQNKPGTHHTQRKTLKWWKVVQSAFQNKTKPHPLIRSKALSTDLNWTLAQIYGHMASAAALITQFDPDQKGIELSIEDIFEAVKEYAENNKDKNGSFNQSVKNKVAKFHRSREKYDQIHEEKTKLGLPSEPFTVYWPLKKEGKDNPDD